jgi:hypothetical protein
MFHDGEGPVRLQLRRYGNDQEDDEKKVQHEIEAKIPSKI